PTQLLVGPNAPSGKKTNVFMSYSAPNWNERPHSTSRAATQVMGAAMAAKVAATRGDLTLQTTAAATSTATKTPIATYCTIATILYCPPEKANRNTETPNMTPLMIATRSTMR